MNVHLSYKKWTMSLQQNTTGCSDMYCYKCSYLKQKIIKQLKAFEQK